MDTRNDRRFSIYDVAFEDYNAARDSVRRRNSLAIVRRLFIPPSPSPLVWQPLEHASWGERVERWPTVAWYRGRTERSLVYELEVHGTFGALLWRVRRRTWQQYRKREVMPQGGGGKGGSDRESRIGGRTMRHNTRANVVVVVREDRVRRQNWRKLSYLYPAENKRRVGENVTLMKSNKLIYGCIFFVLSSDWKTLRHYLRLSCILLQYRYNAENDGQR